MSINFEEEITNDKKIDESNLIGELKAINDLKYKWNNRLNIVANELKKVKIEIDRLKLEKHIYYKHDYEIDLKDSEIKLYVDGDIDIVKLRNQRRILETKHDMLKTAVFTIVEKRNTLKELIDLSKYDN